MANKQNRGYSKRTGAEKEDATRQKRSSNHNGKGRKSGYNNDVTPDNFKEVKGYCNDPSWYKPTDQTVKDATSLSFNQATGLRLDWGNKNMKDTMPTIPGVAVLSLHPTVGKSVDQNSAINVAARQIYSFVRHMNSGSKNYDPTDLMMYLMAVDNVYSFHAWMRRTYGLLQVYAYNNRYYPRGILYGMNIDAENIINVLPQFRAYINMYALRASTLCVPNILSLMKRHYFMYEGVWMDSSSVKGQVYAFNPDGFYFWDKNQQGTKLSYTELHAITEGLTKFSAITAIGDQMLNDLLSEEDVGIISGDIMKAFGVGSLWHLPETPEDYMTNIAFNAEILTQIHNATIVSSLTGVEITQDLAGQGPIIKFDPKIHVSCPFVEGNRLLSAPIDHPGEDLVLEMTRLSLSATGSTYDQATTSYVLTNPSYGSEICVGMSLTEFNPADNTWNTVQVKDSVKLHEDLKVVPMITAFDYHPNVWYCQPTDWATKDFENGGMLWTYTNTRMTTPLELRTIDDIAIMGEFAVGSVGTQNLAT